MNLRAGSAVTPVLLTFDEAPNLPRTLAALAWADRVVVLDSGSTDGSEEIARSFPNVDWRVRRFDDHGRQWAHAVRETGIATPYALALDADMEVPAAFVEEVERDFLPGGYDGAIVRFEYRYFGRALPGSLYPPQLRVFRPGSVRIDQPGHSQEFSIDGRVARLKSRIGHDDRKPLEAWVRSQVAYSRLEAGRLAGSTRPRLRDRLRVSGALPPVAFLLAYLRAGGPWRGAASARYAYERAIFESLLAIRVLDVRLAAPAPGRGGRRGLALRLLVLAAATVGLAELSLRVQEPFLHLMARRYNQVALHVDDPRWDHGGRPGLDLELVHRDQGAFPDPYRVRTDRFGFRSAGDVRVPKPAGVRRVFVLGDSFTEGNAWEDTVAARLQASLGPADAWEVVNAGCSSYSPLLHRLRLEQQILDLEPDAVIVNVDLTDVFDDWWRYRPRCRLDAAGEPEGVGTPAGAGRRMKDWLKGRSCLARVIATLKAGGRPVGTGERSAPVAENVYAYHSTLPIDSEDWRTEVGYMLRNLEAIARRCRSAGVPLAITTYPHREQIEPDASGRTWHREVERRIEELCRGQEVAFWSAFEPVAEAFRRGDRIYWEDDMHFTPIGQRVWADAFAAFASDWLVRGTGAR